MEFAKNSLFTVIRRLRPFPCTKHICHRMFVAADMIQRVKLSNPQRREILRQIHLLNIDPGEIHCYFGQLGV